MINKELLSYVKKSLALHKPQAEIRAALIQSGWALADIDAAFNAVTSLKWKRTSRRVVAVSLAVVCILAGVFLWLYTYYGDSFYERVTGSIGPYHTYIILDADTRQPIVQLEVSGKICRDENPWYAIDYRPMTCKDVVSVTDADGKVSFDKSYSVFQLKIDDPKYHSISYRGSDLYNVPRVINFVPRLNPQNLPIVSKTIVLGPERYGQMYGVVGQGVVKSTTVPLMGGSDVYTISYELDNAVVFDIHFDLASGAVYDTDGSCSFKDLVPIISVPNGKISYYGPDRNQFNVVRKFEAGSDGLPFKEGLYVFSANNVYVKMYIGNSTILSNSCLRSNRHSASKGTIDYVINFKENNLESSNSLSERE